VHQLQGLTAAVVVTALLAVYTGTALADGGAGGDDCCGGIGGTAGSTALNAQGGDGGAATRMGGGGGGGAGTRGGAGGAGNGTVGSVGGAGGAGGASPGANGGDGGSPTGPNAGAGGGGGGAHGAIVTADATQAIVVAGGNGGGGGDASGYIGAGGGGGAGGYGAVVDGIGISYTNAAGVTILGGGGGRGGSGGANGNPGSPGSGGHGVYFTGRGTLTNAGTIAGGAGGAGLLGGGDAGAGVVFASGGTLSNSGTITGGAGGSGNGNPDGSDGSGVKGADLAITNAGTIASSNGYAVELTGGTNTLTMQPGSAITGAITVSGTLAIDPSASATLSSSIVGTGSVTKTGTGTLTLTANNWYTGSTTVSAGTLELASTAGLAGPVTVAAGATLSGTGRVGNNVTIAGTLSPGSGGAPGTLVLNGATFNSGSTFATRINNRTAVGQLGSAGTVVLGGNPTLTITLGYAPSPGDSFAIVRAGSVTGTFANAPNGATLTASFGGTSYNLVVSYVSGRVVTLTAKTATTTVVASSQNPSGAGQSVTFTATVSGASPTGTVAFQDNGATISGCGAQTISGGSATCATSSLSVGSHQITAVYGGDGKNLASTSSALAQDVPAPTATPTVTSTSTPTGTPTPTNTPTPTGTPTPTRTPGASATATATGAGGPPGPTPTRTPLVLPTIVATAVRLGPSQLPTFVPTPDPALGGQVVLVPTQPPGATAQAVVVDRTDGAPFPMTLLVPPPANGDDGRVVRVQQATAAPTALPTGVAVAKLVQVDVYDLATGALVHHHAPPLTVAVQLDEGEKAVCRVDPARIALLHVGDDGALARYPIASLDCGTGILVASLPDTSSYAVATLGRSTALTFRTLVIRLPEGASPAGW